MRKGIHVGQLLGPAAGPQNAVQNLISFRITRKQHQSLSNFLGDCRWFEKPMDLVPFAKLSDCARDQWYITSCIRMIILHTAFGVTLNSQAASKTKMARRLSSFHVCSLQSCPKDPQHHSYREMMSRPGLVAHVFRWRWQTAMDTVLPTSSLVLLMQGSEGGTCKALSLASRNQAHSHVQDDNIQSHGAYLVSQAHPYHCHRHSPQSPHSP